MFHFSKFVLCLWLGAVLTVLSLTGCSEGPPAHPAQYLSGPKTDAPCIAAVHDASRCRGYAGTPDSRNLWQKSAVEFRRF